MKKGMNKKAITAEQVVYLLIAVLVLVGLVLIWYYNIGNVRGIFLGYSSSVNVDSVKQTCDYLAKSSTPGGSNFNYCCTVRNVIYTADQKVPEKTTCSILMADNAIDCSDTCTNVVCDGDYFVGKIGHTYEVNKTCLKGKTTSSKTLDKELKPISGEQVCCVVKT